MKRKKVYTCGVCGCKISKHKVQWHDGHPYCRSCERGLEKTGASGGLNQWEQIVREELRKRLRPY